MGLYYFYVNETKREYFCIDPTGLAIKDYALGHNIGSRALSYLLLENDPHFTGVEPHRLVGSWIGDRFYVTGDDYCPAFGKITSEYADIGQSIIDMLVEIAPFDLIKYGGSEWLVNLMEHNSEHVTITSEMRRRLLKEFRHENHLCPSDDMAKIIAALRPRDQTGQSHDAPD